MIGQLMGDVIDIHGGGRDLVFPHHENELAQARVRPCLQQRTQTPLHDTTLCTLPYCCGHPASQTGRIAHPCSTDMVDCSSLLLSLNGLCSAMLRHAVHYSAPSTGRCRPSLWVWCKAQRQQ